jgi:hypothetical protein
MHSFVAAKWRRSGQIHYASSNDALLMLVSRHQKSTFSPLRTEQSFETSISSA